MATVPLDGIDINVCLPNTNTFRKLVTLLYLLHVKIFFLGHPLTLVRLRCMAEYKTYEKLCRL